jgi:hypothetical protein
MTANYDIVKDKDKGFQNGLLHVNDNAAIGYTGLDNVCADVLEAKFEDEKCSVDGKKLVIEKMVP